MTDSAVQRRDHRLELVTTEEERALLDRAVEVAGTNLSDFVVTHASDAARRVLANRQSFDLEPAAAEAWEDLNQGPARELPGLALLLDRQPPFSR